MGNKIQVKQIYPEHLILWRHSDDLKICPYNHIIPPANTQGTSQSLPLINDEEAYDGVPYFTDPIMGNNDASGPAVEDDHHNVQIENVVRRSGRQNIPNPRYFNEEFEANYIMLV